MFDFESSNCALHSSEIELAKNSELTVLITGETGSGKSTLAETIHKASSRKNGPFISINVASLNENLIEAELFGAEKGSYTGADQLRRGKLELAQGGTLFLDEIGELPPYLQVKLLEFLQNKKIFRVGGERPLSLNVRILAATNKNLELLIKENRVREDFYFRLEQIRIHLDSLREKRADFDSIVHEIIDQLMKKYTKNYKKMTEKFARILENYSWPGNFRELISVLEYSVLSCQDEVLREENLPRWFYQRAKEQPRTIVSSGMGELDYKKRLYKFEKGFFAEILAKTHGNLAFAAEVVGMNKTTFLRKINELDLKSKAQELKKQYRSNTFGLKSGLNE